jgi:hypothetical protein
MDWSQEELIGLGVLLSVIVGLALLGKLTSEAVDGIRWVGASFMASKGLSGLLPASKGN